MLTSNPVFFTVRDVPPLPEAGWEVRVRDNLDFTTLRTVVAQWTSLTVGTALNDPGAGTITIDADSPFWRTTLTDGQSATVLLDREYLWEAYEDGALRAQWLGTNVAETVVGEDETPVVIISGPGPAAILKWAIVLPPGFPAPMPKAGVIWPWTNHTPAMQIWLWLFYRARERGVIHWLNPSFTSTADSGGVIWSDVKVPFIRLDKWIPELGADLLTVLNTLTGQDLNEPAGVRADWTMYPNFRLDIRPVIGVHKERLVVFHESATILARDRLRNREAIANRVVVRDANGTMSVRESTTSVGMWNRREALNVQGNLTADASRNTVAGIMLEQHKNEMSSWTITVAYGSPGHEPWKDFDLGDWVGVERYNPHSANSALEAYRVMGITVNVDADGVATLELTLQSVLDAQMRKLQIAVTSTINKINNTIINNPAPPNTVDYNTSGTGGSGDTSGGTGGIGGFGDGSGRPRVFVGEADPTLISGNTVETGDFWVETYNDPALP